MDHSQILVLALANVPTIIAVLIGILQNNGSFGDLNGRFSDLDGRFADLNSRMSSFEGRMASIENRMTNLESKFDTRFDLLLSKVVEIDNRLIRLERH